MLNLVFADSSHLSAVHQSDGGDSYSDSDGVSCTEYFSEAYQESDADDCYANSDRASCGEDLSELWDEQSGVPRITKL
jgi:hypothetical protein